MLCTGTGSGPKHLFVIIEVPAVVYYLVQATKAFPCLHSSQCDCQARASSRPHTTSSQSNKRPRPFSFSVVLPRLPAVPVSEIKLQVLIVLTATRSLTFGLLPVVLIFPGGWVGDIVEPVTGGLVVYDLPSINHLPYHPQPTTNCSALLRTSPCTCISPDDWHVLSYYLSIAQHTNIYTYHSYILCPHPYWYHQSL